MFGETWFQQHAVTPDTLFFSFSYAFYGSVLLLPCLYKHLCLTLKFLSVCHQNFLDHCRECRTVFWMHDLTCKIMQSYRRFLSCSKASAVIKCCCNLKINIIFMLVLKLSLGSMDFQAFLLVRFRIGFDNLFTALLID